jgi:hypothetical protein
MVGQACSRDERDENAYTIIVRKSEKEKYFSRHMRVWEYNIKMDVE